MFRLFDSLFKLVAVILVGLVILILVGIPLGTWVYLHLNPARVDATVRAKSEDIYYGYSGSWKQYLWLGLSYTPRDTPIPEHTTIVVDEGTWEQSSPGSHVVISYVPVSILRQIPMYYTIRLAQPWPPVSPGPEVQRSASAVVRNVHHIVKVGGTSRSRGMKAWQPFDVLELSFVPEGRKDAVMAVDSVDTGSVGNLFLGQSVSIVYFTGHPRAATIVDASRDHTWKNNLEVFSFPGALVLLVLLFLVRHAGKSRRASTHAP